MDIWYPKFFFSVEATHNVTGFGLFKGYYSKENNTINFEHYKTIDFKRPFDSVQIIRAFSGWSWISNFKYWLINRLFELIKSLNFYVILLAFARILIRVNRFLYGLFIWYCILLITFCNSFLLFLFKFFPLLFRLSLSFLFLEPILLLSGFYFPLLCLDPYTLSLLISLFLLLFSFLL